MNLLYNATVTFGRGRWNGGGEAKRCASRRKDYYGQTDDRVEYKDRMQQTAIKEGETRGGGDEMSNFKVKGKM